MTDTGIIIIGTGRLSRTIARTFPDQVTGVVGRSIESAEIVSKLCSDALPATALSAIPAETWTILWIATPDRIIPEIVDLLYSHLPDWNGRTVLHSSGATSHTVLNRLHMAGATALALHPNLSLTGQHRFPTQAYWGYSCYDQADMVAAGLLLEKLRPRFIRIADQFRSLYHASASAAANYSISVFELAVALYVKSGVPEADARTIVAAFMNDSVAKAQIPYKELHTYLTGPVTRGDQQVVQVQQDAVRTEAPLYADAFDALTALTRRLLHPGTDPE